MNLFHWIHYVNAASFRICFTGSIAIRCHNACRFATLSCELGFVGNFAIILVLTTILLVAREMGSKTPDEAQNNVDVKQGPPTYLQLKRRVRLYDIVQATCRKIASEK